MGVYLSSIVPIQQPPTTAPAATKKIHQQIEKSTSTGQKSESTTTNLQSEIATAEIQHQINQQMKKLTATTTSDSCATQAEINDGESIKKESQILAARLPIMAEKAKLALPPALDSKEPDLGVAAEAIRDPRAVKGGASSDFEDRSREDLRSKRNDFRDLKHRGGSGRQAWWRRRHPRRF